MFVVFFRQGTLKLLVSFCLSSPDDAGKTHTQNRPGASCCLCFLIPTSAQNLPPNYAAVCGTRYHEEFGRAATESSSSGLCRNAETHGLVGALSVILTYSMHGFE